MTTHFITAEITRQESPLKTYRAIEAGLRTQGEPLRWAVIRVDGEKLYVEAVVITTSGVTPA